MTLLSELKKFNLFSPTQYHSCDFSALRQTLFLMTEFFSFSKTEIAAGLMDARGSEQEAIVQMVILTVLS